MKKGQVVGARRLRRFLQAEKVCQALREYITAPAHTTPTLKPTYDFLLKWVRMAPKNISYKHPEP